MMKPNKQWGIAAVLLGVSVAASAQTAGTWMARAGIVRVAPQVASGNLSAPSFANSTTDVGPDTQPGGGISYMLTDNVSVDVPLALPLSHKIYGAGAIAGVGQIATVKALPITVFLQYRFLAADSKFRPYVGLGATYAKFYGEQGSAALTALTNPGGPATQLKIDSKWIVTPQIGMTYAFGDKWFVDVFYSKAKLSTTTTLSTGQTLDAALDPASYGVTVGVKF
jgi:outer membrane protein